MTTTKISYTRYEFHELMQGEIAVEELNYDENGNFIDSDISFM